MKANALFKTLMSIVNIIFPLLTAPYVARILSVDGYTEYNRASSVVSWFTPFAVFGVYTYGMRTMSRIKGDRMAVSRLFTRLFAFSVFASVAVSAVYVCLVIFAPMFSQYRLMYAICASQILFVCFSTDWANEAFESYGFILAKTFFCRLLYVVSVFVLVRDEGDVLMYVLLSSLSTIVNNFLTFCYAKSRIRFSSLSLRDVMGLIKPLFIVFLLVNASMLYTVFDRFMLTWFSDKLSLTYYNISQTIVLAVTNVTSSLLLVSIPRLSYLWGSGKKDEYYGVLRKTSMSFMALHIPCCIGLASLASEVIHFYSGTRYIAAALPLALFSARYVVSAFDMILAKQVMLATGNEKSLVKIYYAAGLYNVIVKAALLLAGRLTAESCIVTTASADIIVIVMEAVAIRKLGIRYSAFSWRLIKYLVASLLFIPVIMLIRHLVPDGGMGNMTVRTVRTVISILLCSVLYFLALLVTKDDFIWSLLRRKSTAMQEEK